MNLKNVKLLILDVDGVLTDGKKDIELSGHQIFQRVFFKSFLDKDFVAIRRFKEAGVQSVIVTGDESNKKIARRYDIPFFVEKFRKVRLLESFREQFSCTEDQMLAVGDDYADIEVLKRVGVSACPSDAIEEVKEQSIFKLRSKGGEGVVAELFDKYRRAVGHHTNREAYDKIYKEEISLR